MPSINGGFLHPIETPVIHDIKFCCKANKKKNNVVNLTKDCFMESEMVTFS